MRTTKKQRLQLLDRHVLAALDYAINCDDHDFIYESHLKICSLLSIIDWCGMVGDIELSEAIIINKQLMKSSLYQRYFEELDNF